jgi:hypothetical protein
MELDVYGLHTATTCCWQSAFSKPHSTNKLQQQQQQQQQQQ